MRPIIRTLSIGAVAAVAAGALVAPRIGTAADGPTVGFLITDFTTSARWQFDKQYFTDAMQKAVPGVNVVADDAKADQTRQQQQAQSLLTAGAKVLVDVPVDSKQAAAIVRAAHSNSPRVPVLSYDRLIEDADVDAYVSFDPISVGRQQAQYIVDHLKSGNIASIAGAATDNNAISFHAGAMQVLMPLVKSGRYKLVYDKFTPNWDSNLGQAEAASALNNNNNNIGAFLVANDGLAGGVDAALKAQHLNGKVIVTGQDATVAGLQNILTGEQSMTIYKPIRKLADAAAKITTEMIKGQKLETTTTVNNGMKNVPSILLPVTTITKANVKTVVDDGYVTKAQLCNGIPTEDCAGL